ncbi:hypothetical protein P4E94_06000 [Pontiellaceae bacterium B12219]|nr:hypothetical protein [Pontiellaceae bacterium B12219]
MNTKPTSTIVVGAPATGKKYWPRPDVTHALLSALGNDHVIFPGPRRTGKTSILIHLRDTYKEPGRAALINAEKYSTASELVQGLAKEVLTPDVAKRTKRTIKSGASKIKGLKIGLFGIDFHQAANENWENAADSLLQGLIETPEPVLIMIDEFSVFVNKLSKKEPDETEKLLRWFREWRQRLVDTRIRFLLTGSIGIDTVLRRLNLGDTINDCRPVEMFPPAEKDAHNFLLQRAGENNIPLTDPLATEILQLINPHWYYPMQLFLVEIQTWIRANEATPDASALQTIYREQLVGKGNELLKHMWDKLSDIFDPADGRFARQLLKALAKDAKGLSRQEMENLHTREFPPGGPKELADFEYILNVLVHDGYLIKDAYGDKKTRFASNLLRDYWEHQNT